MERSRIAKAVQGFATARSHVPPEAIRIAGPELGRNFVVKIQGDVATAARRIDELVDALRDQSGHWRALDVQVKSGGMIRVYLGRDIPWKLMQGKVFGKRRVAILQKQSPK